MDEQRIMDIQAKDADERLVIECPKCLKATEYKIPPNYCAFCGSNIDRTVCSVGSPHEIIRAD
ncbi:hypothetical protein [Effusibacillus dendaii]|uniref:Uncharacterized protein n=1 Tax=Effusibacillus dendaii TaxID=2743772 RepID=A0A7I8D8T9_9BACL|nr:hypothetical protein [Effusibacillus dendaii]BCJ86505.1 hypothetical protein skT53_14900 [Effusibacillus dendaii]